MIARMMSFLPADALRGRERRISALCTNGKKKSACNGGRAECGQHAGGECRAETRHVGEQAESRRAEAERHVEKSGVSAHCESPALHRDVANRFDTKSWIDERVADSGQGGANQREPKPC